MSSSAAACASSMFGRGGTRKVLRQHRHSPTTTTRASQPRHRKNRHGHPEVQRIKRTRKEPKSAPVHYKRSAVNIKRGVQESYDGAGKTVLITGANSGIGLESSKQLVSSGCTVVMACRTAEKARQAVEEVAPFSQSSGGRAIPAVLDLASLSSVRAFADDYLESGAPLHVLVCNAVSPLSLFPKHGHRGTAKRRTRRRPSPTPPPGFFFFFSYFTRVTRRLGETFFLFFFFPKVRRTKRQHYVTWPPVVPPVRRTSTEPKPTVHSDRRAGLI